MPRPLAGAAISPGSTGRPARGGRRAPHLAHQLDIDGVGASVPDAARAEFASGERAPKGSHHIGPVMERDGHRFRPATPTSTGTSGIRVYAGIPYRNPSTTPSSSARHTLRTRSRAGRHAGSVASTYTSARGSEAIARSPSRPDGAARDRDRYAGRGHVDRPIYRPISRLMINCWISLVPSVIEASFASR